MRRSGAGHDGLEVLATGPATPEVVVEVCTCGCTPAAGTPVPEWPLASAWVWLTAAVEPDPAVDWAPDPADAPGGHAAGTAAGGNAPEDDGRAAARRRRAVLPLVLLAELQGGVLARALWEVLHGRSGSLL